MPLQRIEALAGIIISIVLAVLPVVGNYDWQHTAGVIAGITAVLGIVVTRLQGWQKQEARDDLAALPVEPVDPGDLDPSGVKHTGLPAS